MELRDSPLWQEISSIAFEQSDRVAPYAYKAEFLANKKRVNPFKLLSLTITRDFRNAYGDAIILEVIFPLGDFVYDVFPYRKDLLVTLSRQGQTPDTTEAAPNAIQEFQQLRATLLDEQASSVNIEGARANAQSKQALNLTDIITVKFQLLDLALERVRLHSVGGLFKDTSPPDVLKYVVTSVSNDLGLDEGNKVRGVEMVDSPNKDTYQQIIIPHGLKFPDLALYLHQRVGGIYPSGLGMYLFRQYWYIYPLYDLTRFDSATKTLTLINLPTNAMPGINRTFRTTANQTIALVTGDVKHLDLTESKLLNEGNGVRYLDARRVMEGYADSEQGDNKAKVMRAENNNEFVTDKRPNGLNNVTTSDTRITANKYYEASRLAKRAGAELQCLWENANLNAIYPGMPVKFMYIKEGQIKELKGVVLGADHYIQTSGKGMTDSKHRLDTTLHLFVSRN